MTTAYQRERLEWGAEVARWKLVAETWKAVAESRQSEIKELKKETVCLGTGWLSETVERASKNAAALPRWLTR